VQNAQNRAMLFEHCSDFPRTVTERIHSENGRFASKVADHSVFLVAIWQESKGRISSDWFSCSCICRGQINARLHKRCLRQS